MNLAPSADGAGVTPPLPPAFPIETATAPPALQEMRAKTSRHPLAVPVTGIFLLMLVNALILASGFLIPVTSAVLGYFILNAPRRALSKIGVPAPVSAGLFTVAIGAVLGFGGVMLSEPISDFVTDLPRLAGELSATLTGPGGMLESVARAADATGTALEAGGVDAPMQVEVVDNVGLAASVASVAPGLVGQMVFAIFLLFFLVASGDLFIQKAVQSADRFQDKKNTVMMIRNIEERLGNYLGAITLINICLGVCIGLGMWWWDVPSPWLIGMMGTVLNFIPFVGAAAGSLIAGVIAFIAFSDPWAALGVFLTYYALTAIEGQLITPTLLGRRLRLNVTMVFLSVAFFAWIWSVMGMVVAVPLLIVIKVVCDTTPRLRKLGLFLGDAEGFLPREDPKPPAVDS